MKKLLEVALVLSAVDKATRVVDAATRQQLNKLNELNNKASNLFGKGAGLTAAGAALAVPLYQATQAAISFEDKMADVGKVLNLKTGSEQLGKVGDQVKTMSEYLALMPEQVAGLYASLAQGGIAVDDLDAVAKIAGEMAVAFDMLPEQAGDAFIKMRNALNLSIPEAKKAVDAMNFLSDTTAAKASQILDFMAAGGASVAGTLKTGAPMMQAFGATLVSIGKSGAEAATIMERFQKGVLSNKQMSELFQAAGGGVNGLLTVLKAGSKLTGQEQFEFFANFGEYGTSVSQLAQNYDLLYGTLKSVQNEQSYFNSATNEFVNRSSTTQGQINQLMTTLKVGMLEFGEVFLPILNKGLNAIKPIVKAIVAWVKENPKLMEVIGIITAIVSAMMILSGVILLVKGGMMVLNATFLANPIVAAVMAIIAVVTLLVIYWDDFMAWFDNQSGIVKAILGVIMQPFVMLAAIVKAVMAAIEGDWTGAWEIIKQAIMNFSPVGIVMSWVSGMYNAGVAVIQGLIDGIKAKFTEAINTITELGDTIADKFKSVLGIRSPSRVFVDFGKNIAAGAAIGVAAGMPMAANASGSLAGSMVPSAVSSSAGAPMNLTYNVSIQGGASEQAREDFAKLLQKHQADIVRILENYNSRQARRQF
jgi:TP901 family phage tail tape measure protein